MPRRRPAADRCHRQQDREGAAAHRRGDRAGAVARTRRRAARSTPSAAVARLATLHMEQTNYPLHVMHGYAIPTREAIDFCEFLRKTKKLAGLAGIEELARARREVLPYGALVLERLLKVLQPERSDLLRFRHPRRADLLAVAGARAAPRSAPQLLRRVRRLALALGRARLGAVQLDRRAVRAAGPQGDARRAASAPCRLPLSDIGWRAHPDYRGEQSLNLLAHAALAGIDHPGRVFLALAIFYRHRCQPEHGCRTCRSG